MRASPSVRARRRSRPAGHVPGRVRAGGGWRLPHRREAGRAAAPRPASTRTAAARTRAGRAHAERLGLFRRTPGSARLRSPPTQHPDIARARPRLPAAPVRERRAGRGQPRSRPSDARLRAPTSPRQAPSPPPARGVLRDRTNGRGRVSAPRPPASRRPRARTPAFGSATAAQYRPPCPRPRSPGPRTSARIRGRRRTRRRSPPGGGGALARVAGSGLAPRGARPAARAIRESLGPPARPPRAPAGPHARARGIRASDRDRSRARIARELPWRRVSRLRSHH